MSCQILGLGLLSIGRQWGVKEVSPPDEETALSLINVAYSNGIKFFDTAPAYARSEVILGRALSSSFLPRQEVTVATKMGEHWDPEENVSYSDHGFDELARSFEQSVERLGQVDLLQLHKANTSNVASRDVFKALDLAESAGVKFFGASVSDLETAEIACRSGRYEYLQFPFNIKFRALESIFDLLAKWRMKAIVNRPFAMGALISDDSEPSHEMLFRFITGREFRGIILTGTSSKAHLLANISDFRRAIL